VLVDSDVQGSKYIFIPQQGAGKSNRMRTRNWKYLKISDIQDILIHIHICVSVSEIKLLLWSLTHLYPCTHYFIFLNNINIF
jgi:hypothetical protein